jgi:hypothetical protein
MHVQWYDGCTVSVTTGAEPGLAEWLAGDWFAAGPNVCVVEGFSGVGKTRLGTQLATQVQPSVMLSAQREDVGIDDLLFNIASEFDRKGEALMADRLGEDLGDALIRQLEQRTCLVVIDDFQDMLAPESEGPDPRLAELIERISRRPGLKGRVLLLTDRSLLPDRWLDEVAVRPLRPPKEEDGIRLLRELLTEADLEREIPAELLPEVVRWLGTNPRALKVLVGCLSTLSLEEMIEVDPESWGARGTIVSAHLVKHLEKAFLERTLDKLDTASIVVLEYLSVYRRSFSRDAVTRLKNVVRDPYKVVVSLIGRFLVERDRTRYSVNPVVRQLALSRLSHRSKRKRPLAHAIAAEHYMRHFAARGNVDLVHLGVHFVEARFHLISAGRQAEFEAVAGTFRRELSEAYGSTEDVPRDPQAREQLIAVLLAALNHKDPGYHRLRFLLVRCLELRGSPGDNDIALKHARMAARTSDDARFWALYVRLLARSESPAAIRTALRQAESLLEGNPRTLIPVQMAVAAALAQKGEPSTAAGLLERVIVDLGRRSWSYPLYELRAMILARNGKYADAIATLVHCHGYLGRDHPAAGVNVEHALLLAHGRGDVRTLERLGREMVDGSGREHLEVLRRVLVLQCQGRYADAAEEAEPAIEHSPVRLQAAFCWLCAGDISTAYDLISGREIPPDPASLWLLSVVAEVSGKLDVSSEAITRCRDLLGLRPERSHVGWLRAWDQVLGDDRRGPAFLFPRLPPALTGLDRDLERLQYGPSALTDHVLANASLLGIGSRPDPGETDEANGAVPATPPIQRGGDVHHHHHWGGGGPVGDSFVNMGQAAGFGKNVKVGDVTMNKSTGAEPALDLAGLGAELDRLKKEMRSKASEDEHDLAIAEVVQAGNAAKDGDEEAVRSHLSRAGRWALQTATAIGAGVAAALIKSAIDS